jgi:hypothetical protein
LSAFASLAETSDTPQSEHDGSALDTSERPDAWLCELTLREIGLVAVAAHPDGPQPSQSGSTPAPGPTGIGLHKAKSRSAITVSSDRIAAGWFEARPGWCLRARASDQGFLPIETGKYLMLLDWTGREIRADKRGAIPDQLAPLLDRLGLDRSNWVNTVRDPAAARKYAITRLVERARVGLGSIPPVPLRRVGVCFHHGKR